MLRHEEFTLNQLTEGVTLSDGVANVDSEIVSYRVPARTGIEIRPTDTIDMYLADTAGVEIPGTSLVTVLIAKDPMGRAWEAIATNQYSKFMETRDKMLIYFLRTSKKIPSDFMIKIKVLSTAAVDDVRTRFSLTCQLALETMP